MSSLLIFFLITSLLSVNSAPTTEPEPSPSPNEVVPPKETYDLSQFDEVYDQRQNGTENYRLNVNKVVVVWAPPGDLLTAALLLDPLLLGDEELSETDDFFKPEAPHKPEVTTAPSESSSAQSSSEATTAAAGVSRRKLRLPGFLRPFVRRHHVQP